MFKIYLKSFLKKNSKFQNFLIGIIYAYLNLVYKTTRIKFALPSNYTKQDFDNERRTIFVMWHNALALAPIVAFNKCINILASSHTDGKIISGLLSRFGYKIIEGSSNRAPIAATRQIIRALSKNENIFITPDGPRGPALKLNSNVVGVAQIANAKIIPLSFKATNYFHLRTWDRLNMPLPFGTIVFTLGEPLQLNDNENLSILELEKTLLELSK